VAQQVVEADGPEPQWVLDLGSVNRLSLLTSGCTDQIMSLSMTSFPDYWIQEMHIPSPDFDPGNIQELQLDNLDPG